MPNHPICVDTRNANPKAAPYVDGVLEELFIREAQTTKFYLRSGVGLADIQKRLGPYLAGMLEEGFEEMSVARKYDGTLAPVTKELK